MSLKWKNNQLNDESKNEGSRAGAVDLPDGAVTMLPVEILSSAPSNSRVAVK